MTSKGPEVEDFDEACIAMRHQDEEIAKLRAKLRDRERRIRLAIGAIPVDGDVDFDTGEQLHSYSRVSERTIQGVMDALNLRRPLSTREKK